MDKLLQHYYDGKFGVPLSLPNRRFEPQGLAMWAKFDDMPNGARRETLECVRRQGILQITLFAPLNTSTDALHAKADEILEYYGVEKSFNIDRDYSNPYDPDDFKNLAGSTFMLAGDDTINAGAAPQVIYKHKLYVMSSYKAQGMPTDAWYMLPITINYHII